ncbi:MAG TPA: selenium cofactor biosynthesis protein YqeC, partial [Anaerolineales bacterium]|nr:selenium cofactor biosynthesis protein YqeC [Anaerolineales bacterium]
APPVLERLREVAIAHGIPLLIEADGSRQLPLKAPGEHEPALPFLGSYQATGPALDLVIVVAGLSALGQPLDASRVHRPERFAELAGLSMGAAISPQAVRRLLLHPQGGLKNIPLGVKRAVLLNQADTPELQSQANTLLGGSAGEPGLLSEYQAVVIASLDSQKIWAVHEPVAGIVLAAGKASRFGRAKQVLEWRGETLVHRAARTALEAGLKPVVVVTGAYRTEIQTALADLQVELVHNPDWEAGQSTSVRAGVDALHEHGGSAVFLLVDQPLVSTSLIQRLVETHAASLGPVIAPQAGGRRANPVLFDRRTFPELLALEGDQGGRQLFSKYAPTWVTWHDESVLREIDTPEDYQSLLELDSP